MMTMIARRPFIIVAVCMLNTLLVTHAKEVVVEVQSPGAGPPVTESARYLSHVTLYIQNSDGSRTPSGWTTRQSQGVPFAFQPGVGLIEGWTEGALRMREGERSWISVPSEKGYGSKSMGSPNGSGSFYIPPNSDLLFDIEVLGKEGDALPAKTENFQKVLDRALGKENSVKQNAWSRKEKQQYYASLGLLLLLPVFYFGILHSLPDIVHDTK